VFNEEIVINGHMFLDIVKKDIGFNGIDVSQ
jgi:hypothetical protein